MLQLVQGKSYVWLFPIYVILFLGGFAVCRALGNFSWGILTLPPCIAFVLLCELKSGVALDSYWRASYPRGTWQYRAIIAWHSVGIILFSIFAYFFIHLPPRF